MNQVTEYRREFHKYPERGWREFRTSARVAELLTGMGYEVAMGPDVIEADSVGGPERLSEARVPFAYVGTVLGIASALGYSTDAWIYNVCGGWVDRYGNDAYNLIFILQAVGAVVMIVSGLLLARLYKKAQAKEASAENRTQA